MDQIPEILAKLDDERRLKMVIRLIPYVAPRLSAQTVNLDSKVESKRPSWMSEGDEDVAHLHN